MRRIVKAVLPVLFAMLPSLQATAHSDAPRAVRVNGVELHYIERGKGEPLILLHGGQGDYRSLNAQVDALSPYYRVIAYSRRYHYPNSNPLTASYRSAYSDAEDLAAFIRRLRLGRVHLVGTSAGALTALLVATTHPRMVRSLVLAEPPILRWAKEDPAGRALYASFMSSIWEPAASAFKAGDETGAMRILVDGFGGAGRFDSLPPEGRNVAMQNSLFFKAATSSRDPFPEVSREKVAKLKAPVMIVEGEKTLPIHRFVNAELLHLLPEAEHLVIPNAGHGSAREKPQAFNEAVLRFLKRPRRSGL